MESIPEVHKTIPAKLMRVFKFSPKRTMGIEVHALYGNAKGFILEQYILEYGKLEKYAAYITNHIEDITHEINHHKQN